ncbi:MAG: single-stranded DNA-binding protein [Cryomorphaceae bacterium]|nr:MAG: single-stranded DNA-binding protein [Cryomorphaceae bacterium]
MNMRNKVQLIGRLGAEPEVKTFDNGQMARMSIATSERYRNNKGEQVEDTQWHNVIAWGKTAEIAGKYLRKGQEVAITGKLETRQYTDKEGNTRYSTQVVCDELLMLGKKDA